jgi:lipid-binding SYLF domain-containing protein
VSSSRKPRRTRVPVRIPGRLRRRRAQSGKGALRAGGHTVAYYSTSSGSLGLQAGAQSKALFMTQDALNEFRNSDGWSAGADAAVALVRMGANGAIDTTSASKAVQAFVLTNAGLMADVSPQSTKVSRLTELARRPACAGIAIPPGV